MAVVKIRKLLDWVLATLKSRVKHGGRSPEEETLLTEAAWKPKQNQVAELAAFREMLRKKYGVLSDSTAEMRADREARG